MMNVGILGAGWLGKALASYLDHKGFNVKVTASSEEGREELKQQHMNAFCVKINEEGLYGDLEFFKGLQVLIISLPPVAYGCFRQLIQQLEHFGITDVILFSSTGIYAGCKGMVDERSPLQVQLPKVKHLQDIEDLFLELPGLNATVLRLGGLWGADRHPVYFLARKDVIEDGDEPVNLVRQDTVCKAVFAIMSRQIVSAVFNVVDEDHRSREVFYTAAAKERNLVLPPFRKSEKPLNRIVSSEKMRFL